MCQALSRKNEGIYSGAVVYLGSILLDDDERIAKQMHDYNIVEILSQIMMSTHHQNLRNSLWLLGNFALSGARYAEAILQHDIFERIIALCQSHATD